MPTKRRNSIVPQRHSIVPNILRERRQQLKDSLQQLTDERFVTVEALTGLSDDLTPRVEIKGRVRIRKAGFYLDIWEDFRDFDTNPHLHNFAYILRPGSEPGSEPAFRYECHPDVDDEPAANQPIADNDPKKRNPYSLTPHFHPHTNLIYPLSHLHFLFHRAERASVIFSLIAWINRDLVTRYYDSGRVKRTQAS